MLYYDGTAFQTDKQEVLLDETICIFTYGNIAHLFEVLPEVVLDCFALNDRVIVAHPFGAEQIVDLRPEQAVFVAERINQFIADEIEKLNDEAQTDLF